MTEASLSHIQREMDQSASFDYFYKLDAKCKVRYLEKTVFIRKEDPYALKNDAFLP